MVLAAVMEVLNNQTEAVDGLDKEEVLPLVTLESLPARLLLPDPAM